MPREGRALDDPMAEPLSRLLEAEGAAGMPVALFGENGLFSKFWTAAAEDIDLIRTNIGQPA